MSDGSQIVTCPLCGTQYNEHEGSACHTSCPVSSGCGLLSCPQCGYEMPPATRLTRWLARWMRRPSASE